MMFYGSEIDESNIAEAIAYCIQTDNMYLFYKCNAWRKLRRKVLEEFHFECQPCKLKGVHTRASDVHHVKPVRRFPALALSKFYYENGTQKQQLIPVCDSCHCAEHKEAARIASGFRNAERWD